MSNIIGVLERLGQNASLRRANKAELELLLAATSVNARAAILGGDGNKLQTLVGATPNVCCGLAPSKEEDDQEEEEPVRDDDEIVSRDGLRLVA